MISFPFIHGGASRAVRCGMAGFVLMAFAFVVPSVRAANKFWNGGTGNWNTSGNWDPAGVPVNGDDVFFPSLGAGAFKLTTNNIPLPARRFRSVTFTDGGYNVRGNAIVVTNGLSSVSGVGGNTVEIDVTLGANQTFVNNTPFFTISGDINLAGFNLTLDASDAGDFFILSGAISGTGNLTKLGAGFLNFSGTPANTYVGSLTISAGEFRMDKPDGTATVTGNLTVAAGASARWFSSDQVNDSATVTVGNTGSLTFNNNSETLGLLDLTGANVSTTTGVLTMNGDLTNRASATSTVLSGNLNLGNITRTFGVAAGTAVDELLIPATISGGSRFVGFPVGILVHAGIVKEGAGRVQLFGTNTFGGGFTANNGFTVANSDGAFGTVPVLGIGGGVTVNPDGQITLVSADIANHRLTVNRPNPPAALSASGSSSWSGPVVLNTNATFTTGGTLAISNAIAGPGGIRLAGGTFRYAGTNANTYTGDTFVSDAVLQLAQFSTGDSIPNGSLQIGDGTGGATVFLLENNQIGTAVDILIADDGLLNLNNFSDFVGDLTFEGGRVMTGSGTITPDNILVIATNVTATISGELNLSGTRTWTVQDGSASPCDLLVSAIIGGVGSLVKTGPGTLCLSGNNTYTGLTTVNEGQVVLQHANALGSTNAGTTLNGASLLTLQNNTRVGLEGLTNNGSGIVNLGALLSQNGSNSWAGSIVINADTVVNTGSAADTLSLSGSISGPANLTKINPGTLFLDGTAGNAFGGDLFALEGLLILGKTVGEAVPHNLILGTSGAIFGGTAATARHTASTLIIGSVTVNAGSLYDLNGFAETIVDLTLNGGGDVQTGTGLLSLVGDVDVNGGLFLGGSTSTINGNLNVGSGTRTFDVEETGGLFGDGADLLVNAVVSGTAAIVKTGNGDMHLTANNTFTGGVTVNDGELNISDNNALGTLAGGTSVTGDGLLGLSDNITVSESLTLISIGQGVDGALQNTGGTNTWSGPISLTQTAVINVTTNTALIVTGVMNAGGGVTKTGPGRLEYAGTAINTYGGITTVNEGSLVLSRTGGDGRSIPAALVVGDGVGGNNADLVDIIGTEAQLNNLAAVTVNSSGLLRLSIPGGEVIGSLAGSGRVQLNGTGLFTGGNNASTVFDGVIAGTGGLTKNGSGTMTLNGFNTYSGATTVAAGTLLVNGGTDSSTVTVSASATLGGTGGVGALNVNNLGNVAPGTSPGALRSRNTVLSPGSNFRVEINGGTVGTSYDQLNVDGTISLNGAQLLVTKSPGFAPADGQQFVILDNDLADAVVGSFGGLLEGALLTAGGTSFRISYVGGTGNDITLTVTNIPARFASSRVEAGNGNGRIDPNECDHLFIALENRSGSALNITGAQLDCLTPGVAVTQHDSDYPTIAALGFGTNTTPFQIRIAPNFACGQNIDFNLVVSAAGFANFSVPFTLNSGGAGAFTTFNSTNIPKAIPDLGTTNSVIVLGSGFRIGKVRVSLHATHSAAGDLRLRLVSPDGTEVLLSANRGGNTPNYGNSCAARTTFDDDAATKITAATAPFAGTFAPEGNLSAFIGEISTGTWRLFADDTVPGDTGVLQCWSLSLAPATCSDGGGECESCLASVAGTLTGSSPTLAERMTRNGVSSGCGNPKDCPGTTFGANPFHYSIHEFTNNGPATCVTVMLNVPCAASTNQLHSSAYLTSFNPSDLCANYLGDSGTSVADGSLGYSFQVGAGAKFVVVVNETNPSGPNQGCGDYTLDLYGLPCPPPVLDIARTDTANRVRLSWSTAYPGYVLRGRNNFNNIPPQIFTDGDFGFTDPINIINGRYVLTNTVPGSLRFYELVK